MAYLKNTINNRVIGDILPDSDVYEFLKGLVQPGSAPAGQGTTSSTSGPRPLYEEIGRDTVEGLLGASLEDSPYQVITKLVGALGAAQDATIQIGTCESNANVTTVEYFPQAGVVGQATNFRTFSVVDNTTPTTVASLAASSGAVVLTANEPNLLPNGTVAVVEGDTLSFKSIHSGTGLADPGGLVVVTIAGFSVGAQDYSNAGYSDPEHGGDS